MDCSPSALMRAARCFQCLGGLQWAVRSYLLCQWANIPTNPCGTPTNCISVDTGEPIDMLGVYVYHPELPGGPFINSEGWQIIGNNVDGGFISDPGAFPFYFSPPGGFPCVWQQCEGCSGSAIIPTAHYVTCPSTNIILQDSDGFFWKLVIDAGGNIGTVDDPGPVTGPWVLDSGSNFWQLSVLPGGLRGTTGPVAGPATTPVPTLNDGLNSWTLVVDAAGNLGATM